jgi:hypothetical protein
MSGTKNQNPKAKKSSTAEIAKTIASFSDSPQIVIVEKPTIPKIEPPPEEDELEMEIRKEKEESEKRLAILKEKMKIKNQSKIEILKERTQQREIEEMEKIQEEIDDREAIIKENMEIVKKIKNEAKARAEEKNKEDYAEIAKLGGAIKAQTTKNPTAPKDPTAPKTERTIYEDIPNEPQFFLNLGINCVYYGTDKIPLKIVNGEWVDREGQKHEIMNHHKEKRMKERGATAKESAWATHYIKIDNGTAKPSWKTAQTYKVPKIE